MPHEKALFKEALFVYQHVANRKRPLLTVVIFENFVFFSTSIHPKNEIVFKKTTALKRLEQIYAECVS